MNYRHVGIALVWSSIILVAAALAVYSNERTANAAGGSYKPDLRPALPEGVRTSGMQQTGPMPMPTNLPAALAYGGLGAPPAALSCEAPPTEIGTGTPFVTTEWVTDERERIFKVCLFDFPQGQDVLVTASNTTDVYAKRVAYDVNALDPKTRRALLIWPGAAPGGTWDVSVTADGFSYDETVEVGAARTLTDEPHFPSLTPLGFRNPLRTADCSFFGPHYAYFPGDSIAVSGTGYPRSTDVEVGIYRRDELYSIATRVMHFVSRTDNRGNLKLTYRLPENTSPGEYWLAAPKDRIRYPGYALNGREDLACIAVVESGRPESAFPENRVPAPNATVLENARLRSGPGTNYSQVGRLPAGSAVTVVGMTDDGYWYQIEGDKWIAAFLVRFQ